MSMSSLTFEEALADLIADYDEIPKRERAHILRLAAYELWKHNESLRDADKPIMDKGRWSDG